MGERNEPTKIGHMQHVRADRAAELRSHGERITAALRELRDAEAFRLPLPFERFMKGRS
jgi:hypothetical protein